MKKSKNAFEQELQSNYNSLAEQYQFRSMEGETLKKAYAQTHQQLQDQIIALQHEVGEYKLRIEEINRYDHMTSESHMNRVQEIDINGQHVSNEMKRMRSDHDAAIANLAENMRKWNEQMRELKRDYDELRKLQAHSHQKLQSQVWDAQQQQRSVDSAERPRNNRELGPPQGGAQAAGSTPQPQARQSQPVTAAPQAQRPAHGMQPPVSSYIVR